MYRTGALGVAFALAILLALIFYFAPIVPVHVSCSSIPRGAAIPSSCNSSPELTFYESPMRATFGFGAYSDYTGYYYPEIAFSNENILTESGAFNMIILPAILPAGVLFLGKARLTRIGKSLMKLLNHS